VNYKQTAINIQYLGCLFTRWVGVISNTSYGWFYASYVKKVL